MPSVETAHAFCLATEGETGRLTWLQPIAAAVDRTIASLADPPGAFKMDGKIENHDKQC